MFDSFQSVKTNSERVARAAASAIKFNGGDNWFVQLYSNGCIKHFCRWRTQAMSAADRHNSESRPSVPFNALLAFRLLFVNFAKWPNGREGHECDRANATERDRGSNIIYILIKLNQMALGSVAARTILCSTKPANRCASTACKPHLGLGAAVGHFLHVCRVNSAFAHLSVRLLSR